MEINIIKEDAFRKQLKKGVCGGFLFFGEEDYLKNFCINSVKSAVCPDETFAVFNLMTIDALDYTPEALSSALMPLPMMADQKLVILNGLAICDMKKSELDDLCGVLSALPEYDYNVFILSIPSGLIDEGNLPKRPSAVLTELSKYLTPVRFESPSGAKLNDWLVKHFKFNGVAASPKLCNTLIERCGRSMLTLASESEKLSFYVLSQERDTLSESDIEAVSPSVISSDAYALANAILDERYSDAVNALGDMKFRRVDPIIILSEVSGVIHTLLSIKLLQLQGISLPEITSILKMNEYRARLYASSASGKSEARLRRALLLCSDADLSQKLSVQGYTAIERLICCL